MKASRLERHEVVNNPFSSRDPNMPCLKCPSASPLPTGRRPLVSSY
jgi:hypothetical protein